MDLVLKEKERVKNERKIDYHIPGTSAGPYMCNERVPVNADLGQLLDILDTEVAKHEKELWELLRYMEEQITEGFSE